MLSLSVRLPAAAAIVLAASLSACGPAAAPPPLEHTGAFDLADGTRIAFAARDDGCLRAVYDDGWVGRACPSPDAPAAYAGGSHFSGDGPETLEAAFDADAVTIARDGGAALQGARVPTARTPLSFAVDDLTLKAELITPPGDGPVPLLVHIGGSERSGSVNRLWMPHQLAAAGIASFVYDKRGVGGSDGRYTQDFAVLGADAAAAIAAAKDAMGDRLGPVAVIGFSQGGWVAPIAAQITPVDGVLVGFGLAVSAGDEEISEITAALAAAGHGPEIVARGAALADAAVQAAAADLAEGAETLQAMKREAREAGWLADVPKSGLTGGLAHNPFVFVRASWRFFDVDTSWLYDPRETIAGTDVPQLWLLGGRDRAAPSDETQAVLRALAEGGADIQVQVFPTADHGIIERDGGPDGPAARYSDGYLSAIIAFVQTLEAAG